MTSELPIGQTAKHGILEEISLVQERSGWCGLLYTGAVRCGFDVVRCGLMQCDVDFMQCRKCKWNVENTM